MMAGYVIAQVEITDPETFKEYQEQVPPTIARYAGEYLVRGGSVEVREGQFPDRRLVVLRFPSVERAREWHDSPEYAGPRALRERSANTNLVIAEGV
jgi:uncharacterized protein (DUF1330 family)